MSDAILDVVPGGTVVVECPAGGSSTVKVGDRLPLGVPADQATAFVTAVNKNKITLGPLKTGEIPLELPCGEGLTLPVTLRVVEMKAEDAPKREAPLAPVKLPVPPWVWIALGAFVVLLLLGEGVRRYLRARRVRVAPRKVRGKPATPPERIDEFIREARRGKLVDNPDASVARKLYSEGYDCLRAYLEHALSFHAPEATTREFAAELKAAVLRHNTEAAQPLSSVTGGKPADKGQPPPPPRRKVDSQMIGTVEALMTQADHVRFASENPPIEDRAAFLKGLEQIRAGV